MKKSWIELEKERTLRKKSKKENSSDDIGGRKGEYFSQITKDMYEIRSYSQMEASI